MNSTAPRRLNMGEFRFFSTQPQRMASRITATTIQGKLFMGAAGQGLTLSQMAAAKIRIETTGETRWRATENSLGYCRRMKTGKARFVTMNTGSMAREER